jgi:transposase-like protein
MEDEGMPQKKHKPEEIVAKLRQVDVLVSQGQSVAEAVRSIGVTQFTYYRWRKEFGGLKTDQVKRLKELEKENERLRKAVSDLTLEKLILREAASGTEGRVSETTGPHPPSCLHRPRPAEVRRLGTVRLSRDRPASADTAEGAARAGR